MIESDVESLRFERCGCSWSYQIPKFRYKVH